MTLPEDPCTGPQASRRLSGPPAGPATTWPPHPNRPGIWKRSRALRVTTYVLGGLTALGVVLPDDQTGPAAPVAAAVASPLPRAVSPSPRSSPTPAPSPSPSYDGLSVLPVAAGVAAGVQADDERDSAGRLLRVSALLRQAASGDGDSWKDTTGREYRLGLVNAPELDECFGRQAHEHRRALLEQGFAVRVYAGDRFDRAVSEVYTADGDNLALQLAATGHVDDRYLARFRDENPTLAGLLTPVFARAKADRVGLWGTACVRPSPQPVVPPRRDEPAPAPQPDADADADAYYANCDAVRAAGKAPIRRGQPGYRAGLDRDGDGQACGAD